MSRKAMLMRDLRSPVLLVVLGTLFVLQQNGRASLFETWPVLLISLGLMLLLERTANTDLQTTPGASQ